MAAARCFPPPWPLRPPPPPRPTDRPAGRSFKMQTRGSPWGFKTPALKHLDFVAPQTWPVSAPVRASTDLCGRHSTTRALFLFSTPRRPDIFQPVSPSLEPNTFSLPRARKYVERRINDLRRISCAQQLCVPRWEMRFLVFLTSKKIEV